MKTLRTLLIFALILFAKISHAQTYMELGEYMIDCNRIEVAGFVYEPEDYMTIVSHWGDGDTSMTTIFVDDLFPGESFFHPVHFYASLGTYTNKHVLYSPIGTAIDSFSYSVSIGCQSVHGKSYRREDTDCEFNGTDEYMASAYNMRIDKDGIPIDTIWTFGEFTYAIDTSDYTAVYTLQPISNPVGYTLMCPDSGHYDFTLADLASGPSFDFGYDCTAEGFDLFVDLYGGYRSVDTSLLLINYGNISCTPHDGTITLEIDPQYDFAGATITPTTVSGSTVTWDIDDISATYEWVSSNYIWVDIVPNATLELGNIACNTAVITPFSGDIDSSNNTTSHCDSIRSAFDPNNKLVTPSGPIDPGTILTYTINFENLGNDSAFNIHILDTLSTNVDASTFEVINASHLMTASLSDYGATKIVRFDFPNIMLPDRSSPNYNKGFVTYSVKAKTSLVPSDEVNNTAYIYFDINPAVVTNTATNFIPDPSSLQELSKEDGISIFPNPAEDRITLINEKGKFDQVLMVNILGQSLQASNLKKGDNTLSIQAFPSGIYYMVFVGKENMRTVKIVKR